MLILNTIPEKTKTGTVATQPELKHQLNIPVEFTDDDDLLTHLLAVAVESVEEDTNSDIDDTANILEHQLNLEGTAGSVPSVIFINQAPVRAVSKIEIYNGDAWADVAATDYIIVIIFQRVEIRFINAQTAEKIRFTFTTGYTDTKRPKRLKQAAILKAADLFDTERSNFVVGTISGNLNTYTRLISKHVRNYW